jgi:hypothetical protein
MTAATLEEHLGNRYLDHLRASARSVGVKREMVLAGIVTQILPMAVIAAKWAPRAESLTAPSVPATGLGPDPEAASHKGAEGP